MTDIHELAASLESTGRRFRFVFFDACLMGNVEVAYALRNAADYVIASPAQTPAAGANYTRQLAHGFFSSDPSDIARTYLSDIVNPDFAASYSDFGLPISCVRTDRLQALADLLYETLPGSSLQNGVFALADGLLNYQAYSEQYSYRPHNFGVRQALRRILLLEDVIRVEAQLDEAVAFYGSTPRFWIGPYIFNYQEMPETETDYCCLSMFLPLKKYADDADKRYNVYGNLNEAFRHTEWYEAAGFNRIGH